MKTSRAFFVCASVATALLAGCATSPGAVKVADNGARAIVTGSNISYYAPSATDTKSISQVELRYFQSSGTSW